jgi:threonine dehydratase
VGSRRGVYHGSAGASNAAAPGFPEPARMISLADIDAARGRIDGHVMVTPCAPAESIGELFGGHAWFKFENLQRTGSFKDRGALNRILAIPEEERPRGVIAASAGNHAQGVAFHAGRLGIQATIVMPERTPLVKVSSTERFGARVVLHGSSYDDAMVEAERLRDARGSTLIPPFDDEFIIAGQGTIGLELLEQVPQMDVLVVPVGGGGLISGVAMAVKSARPSVRVIGVEAERLPAALRARQAGHLVTTPPGETIADGIAVRRIGELTFPLIERWVDDLVTVHEEEIASAVLLLLEREKTVAEPAAAVTIAALLGGRVRDPEGRNVVMLLSGGNIDVNLLSRIIDRGLYKDGRQCLLRVQLADRPGSLARITGVVAEVGANVLRLDHRRGAERLGLTEAEVVLALETRGPAHVEKVLEALRAAGFAAERGA